jgi:hypothetical protein
MAERDEACRRTIELMLDAVWPLAVAAGRREAAEDIRAGIAPGTRLPDDIEGKTDDALVVAEWAARIAEGEVPS